MYSSSSHLAKVPGQESSSLVSAVPVELDLGCAGQAEPKEEGECAGGGCQGRRETYELEARCPQDEKSVQALLVFTSSSSSPSQKQGSLK